MVTLRSAMDRLFDDCSYASCAHKRRHRSSARARHRVTAALPAEGMADITITGSPLHQRRVQGGREGRARAVCRERCPSRQCSCRPRRATRPPPSRTASLPFPEGGGGQAPRRYPPSRSRYRPMVVSSKRRGAGGELAARPEPAAVLHQHRCRAGERPSAHAADLRGGRPRLPAATQQPPPLFGGRYPPGAYHPVPDPTPG